MEAENNQGNLFRNFFSQSLLQVANNLLPIISIPIIVRIIGPDKFGVINFATVVMSYFILLTNYGFDLTATRAIAIKKNDLAARSEIFNTVLYAKLFLFLISLITFCFLLYTMPQLYLEKKVAIYSFLIVFSFVLTPTWLYQGMQQLYNIAIFNFITKLLFTIAVLFVIREKQDYVWQPFMISVAHILVGICAFFWAVKKYSINIFYVPFKKVLHHLWEERTIFFSFVSINVYLNASQLILGLVQTTTDVAYFSASFRMVNIMHTIVTIPLGMSLFPFIGESFGRSKEEGLERVQMTAPFIVYLTVIMGIGVWLMAPYIILIFYGEAFRPSISILRILCFLPVALGVSNLMGVQTMVNLRLDKPYSRIIIIGSVFGVVINLWLAKAYSYIGGAWALLFTEILLAVLMWFYLDKNKMKVLSIDYFRPKYIVDTVRPILQNLRNKFKKEKKA